MNKFAESQFEILLVYEFQRKANSYEHICSASVWGYLIVWVAHKSEFWWRNLLSLSLKLCKFMSFKPRQILMKKIVVPQLECYVCLWVSNKREFLCRLLLCLSLKFCMFMSFKQNRILMNAFVESQFGVI